MTENILPHEARLREVEDRLAIIDVINRYGEGVRVGDAALVLSCFADDGSVDHGLGHTVKGAEELARYFKRALGPDGHDFDERVHRTPMMANVQIELNGDTAHCESMCLACHAGARDGRGTVVVRGTRNVDELVRTPQGWKISERTHPAVWAFEVAGTLLADEA